METRTRAFILEERMKNMINAPYKKNTHFPQISTARIPSNGMLKTLYCFRPFILMELPSKNMEYLLDEHMASAKFH